MTKDIIKYIFTAFALLLPFALPAQTNDDNKNSTPIVEEQERIIGIVVDYETGDSIQLASMRYKKKGEVFTSDMNGKFNIPKYEKQHLVITAVGYKPLDILIGINTPKHMQITLRPDSKHLKQVEIRTKKKKYSRKENPAVELMRRVIAANKSYDLKKSHDYYKYNNYQKITLAVNDINPAELEAEQNKQKRQWYLDQLMICPQNGKLILPFTMEEIVSENAYRRSTNSERNTIIGQNTEGVNTMIETGNVVNKLANEVFTDIDLYKNQIRMLQYPFTSPIGSSAINFYRYYIVDTLMVGPDRCIQLEFLPNNQQDFGFRGNLYVLADSLNVRRCELTIPKKSDVNWVDNIKIDLEYEKLATGEWVLTKDDMFCELSIVDFLTKGVVFRTTRRTNYSFDPLPDELFEGFGKERTAKDRKIKGEDFWAEHRTATMTQSEAHMNDFVKGMKKTKGFGILLAAFKIATENFISLGNEKNPPKVEIGPINTVISHNFYDGLRTRASFMTTGNLSSHWFLKGYYARGWKSKKNYYSADVTYSLNEKELSADEYPKRKITLSASYDNMAPEDQFSSHDKDNIFTALRWKKNDKRIMYTQRKIAFDFEQHGGMEYLLHYNWEKQEGLGNMEFPNMTLSEIMFGIRFAPGENTVNTKRRRVKVNNDNPIFELNHTIGFNGFLGGTQKYNTTEASAYYRIWFNSWGRISLLLKGGIQWNRVPYMLLLQPRVNTSFVTQRHTFNLMNDMEFLNDRYAQFDFEWDLNGKIFNRIPLLKKLKWREYLGFKMLWGGLSERNMPTTGPNGELISAYGEATWPVGSHIMDSKKPYMEAIIGIHNIFKFFHIQYVRRLNYHELENVSKNGVRIKFEVSF